MPAVFSDGRRASARLAWFSGAAVLIIAAALLTAPWHGHLDDDSQLYLVIVRNIAAGKGWFDLRYLPCAYDHFREHLPFGFWPWAALVRVFGEGAVRPLAAAWTLATVALIGIAAARLAGPWGGVVAMLSFCLPDSIWLYGGRLRLDAPLLFLATASSLPFLRRQLRLGGWLWASAFAAAAALTKGPFGLLPLCAAALASGVVQRSPRRILLGAAAATAAAIPLLLFLGSDRIVGDGSWWRGYVDGQLLASLSGRRTDGELTWYYPFSAVLGRFWPGLPFVLLGLVRGARDATRAVLEARTEDASVVLCGLNALLLLLALCVPARKVWNHDLLAFPALALLVAAAVEPWLSLWIGSHLRRAWTAFAGLCLAAGACSAASLAGLGVRLLPPPCVTSSDLAAPLNTLAPGTPVLVVAPSIAWRMLENLAAERALLPCPVTELPLAPTPGESAAHLALVEEPESATEPKGPWVRTAWARGWSVRVRR